MFLYSHFTTCNTIYTHTIKDKTTAANNSYSFVLVRDILQVLIDATFDVSVFFLSCLSSVSVLYIRFQQKMTSDFSQPS